MTFNIYLFPSNESLLDTVDGYDAPYSLQFDSEEQAINYFKQEFGDSDWCYLTEDTLANAREAEALIHGSPKR